MFMVPKYPPTACYDWLMTLQFDRPATTAAAVVVTPQIGSFENADDLNGAQAGLKPPFRFTGQVGGGVWQAVGVVVMTAGWWAVVGSLGVLGGLAVVATAGV